MKTAIRSTTLIIILIGVATLIFQKPNPIPTDFETAQTALSQIQDWAKWMTGLQTAAIAGLAWLLLHKDTKILVELSVFQTILSMVSFISLGIAIFCSGWILSSVPSILIRLSEKVAQEPSIDYDVYEQSLYGFTGPIKLSHLMSLNHWYWGGGLFCLGVLVLSFFYSKSATK